MFRNSTETPEVRKIKVRLPESTWKYLRSLAAYLGVNLQDLLGWLIATAFTPWADFHRLDIQSIDELRRRIQDYLVTGQPQL